MIQYVAVGMAAGPIGQLRGYLDPREKLERVRDRRIGIEIEITQIQHNQHEGPSSTAVFKILSFVIDQLKIEFSRNEPKESKKEFPERYTVGFLYAGLNVYLNSCTRHCWME